jgi:hypothetical protein
MLLIPLMATRPSRLQALMAGTLSPAFTTPLHCGPVPSQRRARAAHHHVYVVELDDRVWNEARFRRDNPGYQLGKPFVYVGMTGLDPDLRFDKHKAGIQANTFVFKYGVRLLPALYAVFNPMPYQAAREMEVELAIGLREAGYGVWQA